MRIGGATYGLFYLTDPQAWAHITLTIRLLGTSNKAEINAYENGIIKTSKISSSIDNTVSPWSKTTLGRELVIGQKVMEPFPSFQPDVSFQGQLADLKIWNIERTATQIQESISEDSILANTGLQNTQLNRVKNLPCFFTFENERETFLILPNETSMLSLSETYNCESETSNSMTFTSNGNAYLSGQYQFIRLSTQVVSNMGRTILIGGSSALYSLTSQYLPELPFDRLEPADQIIISPATDRLDYEGANQLYFWEIFFHIPFHIANALNQEQKFEEAKKWYEYIFNPFTEAEPAGLIGDWPMNEGEGTKVFDKIEKNTGVIESTANEVPLWEIAADFPGFESRPVLGFRGTDIVRVDDFPGYPSSEYTLECWVKINYGDDPFDYFTIDYGSDFHLYFADKKVHIEIGGAYLQTNVILESEKWYHIALVFQKLDNDLPWKVKMFVNAELAYSTDEAGLEITSDKTIFSNPNSLEFGKSLQGYLSDVHLWDIARTAEEILLDYNTHHSSDRFWQFLPFRNHDLEKMNGMVSNPREIAAYNTDPFDPHAVARMRIGAYEKAIVMRYIDNLLDWGDNLFTQDNWEDIVRATMLYLVAKNLLGAKPETTELLQEPVVKTFDNILEDASLNIPDYQLALEVEVETASDSVNMQNLPYNAFEPYFCIPENGDFLDYWTRVEDRLYKIRHCMNIEGVVRSLALFQPPIDPNQLIGALAAGGSLASLGAMQSTSLPHYRFTYLINQVKELTEQLKGLGATMLDALEKKDVRQLELLRASNESAIQDMGLLIREKQIEELKENLQGLEVSLKKTEYRQGVYEDRINEMYDEPTGEDKVSIDLKIAALSFKTVTPFLRIPAIGGYLMPKIFGFSNGNIELGNALDIQASISDDLAEILSIGSDLAAARSVSKEQAGDWEFQKGLGQYDVNQIQTQIQAANLQIQIAEQELAIQQKSISQAQDMEAFIKNRFSNQELYQWMIGQLSSVYFQTYQLAFDLALSAEKAYQFELNSTDSFIGFGTWDSLQKGLLSGEQLSLRLSQLEKAYTDNNRRQLEIDKTVYLSQLDPLALLELKENGSCTFELTEKLFDLDFPGHYNRKIKTLGLTVQAEVGNYQSIQATLVQNSNRIVLQPDVNTVAFLLGEDGASQPDATHLRSNWRTNQQIAISNGTNDDGLFELNFMDDRYLPFEGTGALSTWTLSMPKASNRFNFESLSDVMLHLKYTATSGGDAFKRASHQHQGIDGRKWIPIPQPQRRIACCLGCFYAGNEQSGINIQHVRKCCRF